MATLTVSQRVFLIAAPVIVATCLFNALRISRTAVLGTAVDAASEGDIHQLERHVAARDSLNIHDEAGRTPLSASLQFPKAMQFLLEHGALPNVPAEGGAFPITIACGNGNDAAVDMLLAHGANIEAADPQGLTPLMIAIASENESTVLDLIRHGANVKAVNGIGTTPAHYAAAFDAVNTLKALADAGANMNAQSHIGVTPLGRAILNGRKNATEFLLKRGCKVIDPEFTAMHYAALAGAQPAQLRFIVEPRMDHKQPKLVETTRQAYSGPAIAIEMRSAEVFPVLAKAGFDLNARGKNGYTPLHLAAIGDNETAVSALIRAGADPDLRDNDGLTPTQLAVKDNCARALSAFRKLAPIKMHAGKSPTNR